MFNSLFLLAVSEIVVYEKQMRSSYKSLEVNFVGQIHGIDVLVSYTEHEFYISPVSSDTIDCIGAFIRKHEEKEFAVFRQHFYPGFKDKV